MTVNPDQPVCMGDCFFECRCWTECKHSWVAGMMYVHDEDLDDVAAVRKVECEKCDKVYVPNED